jgi:hypothetical protein
MNIGILIQIFWLIYIAYIVTSIHQKIKDKK